MDDVNIGSPLIILTWVLFAISTFILAARLSARALRKTQLGVDDYLMVAAWTCELIHCVCVTNAYKWGLGRHFGFLSGVEKVNAIKWSFMLQAWAIASSMFGRVSFCVFLLRILGPNVTWQKLMLWGCITVQVLANISCIIQIYTQCGVHVEALWDETVHANCMSPSVQTVFGFIQSSINSVTDLILTILPATILWGLQMRRSLKAALTGVLGLSVFAMVASIVKCIEIRNLGARGDFTYNIVIFQIWVAVENNIVITAASIPMLRPLARKPSPSAQRSYTELPESRQRSRPTGARSREEYDIGTISCIEGGRNTPGSMTPAAGDGSSEQHILQPLGDQRGEQRITKTMEVNVRYSHEE